MAKLDEFINMYVKDKYLYSMSPDVYTMLPQRINKDLTYSYNENIVLDFVKERFPEFNDFFKNRPEVKRRLDTYEAALSKLNDQQLLAIYNKTKHIPYRINFINEIYTKIKDVNIRKQIRQELVENGRSNEISHPTKICKELDLDEIDKLLTISMNKGDYTFACELAYMIASAHPFPFQGNSDVKDKKLEAVTQKLNTLCRERIKYELTNGLVGKTRQRDIEGSHLEALFINLADISIDLDKNEQRIEEIQKAQQLYKKLPEGKTLSLRHMKNNKLKVYATGVYEEKKMNELYGLNKMFTKEEIKAINLIQFINIFRETHPNVTRKELEEAYYKYFGYNHKFTPKTTITEKETIKKEEEQEMIMKM